MEGYQGSAAGWNRIVEGLPGAHFLQTWEWAQVKGGHDWTPMPFVWRNGAGREAAACMVLRRQVIRRGLAARLSILYAPKGPLLDWADASLRDRVLEDLEDLSRRQGAIFLKVDPDVSLGRGIPPDGPADDEEPGGAVKRDLIRRGWIPSADQIQFRNTVLIDLAPSEEDLLARMKQKTRYNLRLAERKGVRVRRGTPDDLPLLFRMYAETSVRDGFVIREEAYYRSVWLTFMAARQPTAIPLLAEVEGEAVAGLFLFIFGDRAYYVYGMSRERHREKMPAYLLQWEAMRLARASGCKVYDLWGAPDKFTESDPLWGVYRFKEGLGGEVMRTLGAYDHAPNRLWYGLYADVMPRILDVMRARGRTRTRNLAGGAG